MRAGPRTIKWRNQEFLFETFTGRGQAGRHPPVWGVWWRNEFIGTMPARLEETTREFETRSAQWLAELLREPAR